MERRQALAPSPTDEALVTVQTWALWLTEVERRIMPHFPRSDARRRVWAYLRGLLSPVERKNGWQIAEVVGEATPYGIQHVLGRAQWDAEEVRKALHTYVVEALGDPHAVLVIDETGFLKKGRHSAGVARQYSGTAGRVENCQIGVFLTYASAQGHLLLDRELYLPQEWTHDTERCAGAGIPPERSFATKPQLARQMLERALDAAVPATWVAGDSVSGDHRPLRAWLEERAQAYVLTVSGKEYVWRASRQWQVKTLLAMLEEEDWCRLKAGDGTKGPRWSDWRWLPLAAPLQPDWCRWLLVRRSLSDPTERTAYVVYAPQTTALATAVQVVGRRWTIEQCFEEAKGEVGLDQYEVRHWTGWYRHITLAMWAYALLTVVRAAHLPAAPPVPTNPAGCDPESSARLSDLAWFGVPLSVREIRHLFWRLVLATQQRVEHVLAWSAWRRWHQGIAQYWHYKRRTIVQLQL
jgi:SRSO17 transposase